MIIVDANLLVYAHVSTLPQHERAREWLDEQLNGANLVGLPWQSLLAFLRLVTNPRIFENPESVSDAWAQVKSWLECEMVWIPQATEDHVRLIGERLESSGAQANLIPDADIAVLAIEHGLLLCSTDSDFGRFPGLRWHNPLNSKN